ncbi:MAG: tRNA (adenosine(37)-N6)-dimethylallyltransferase MiaA [Magnetospirillum sp. WYHS-4]
MDAPVVIVAGPTASGKSALAVDIALEFGGEVVNADSMQVYRELHALTARPSPAEEAKVPHRLFGVLPAAQACSVARWLELARPTIAEVRAAGRLPVVVGGTGLYLKALREGLAPVPPVPDILRKEVEERHDRIGGAAFRAELATLDPETAARLPDGDRQRLVRAFAVAKATGRPLAAWKREAPAAEAPVPGPFLTLALDPPRDVLYAACDVRFGRMLEEGALAEAEALLALNLDPALPAMKAVGLPELARFLAGDGSLEEAAAKARQATRNYAKRQCTWLRHQLRADLVLGEQYSESLKPKIFSFIRRFLLTEGF